LSGVADHLAENDEHAIAIARNIVANLNKKPNKTADEIEAPRFDSSELYGIVPSDARKPFDIREVIARIVDGHVLMNSRHVSVLPWSLALPSSMECQSGLLPTMEFYSLSLHKKARILLNCVPSAIFR
jgi:Acetyl-CoA carboxylase, carboxyltransferase component (subunits alpha and beta)